MDSPIVRGRLLAELHQRHRLSVVALETPAGYGRTVLLRQALDSGPVRPSDRDVWYPCGPDDARIEDFARALAAACAEPGSEHPADIGDTGDFGDTGDIGDTGDFGDIDGAARAVAHVLAGAPARAGAPGRRNHVALVVDNVERAGVADGDGGAAFWPALLDRLPAHVHLVLSGRRLPRIGVARHVAAGTGLLLDADNMAFRPDELAQLGSGGAQLALADAELGSWPALAGLIVQGRPELVPEYVAEAVLGELDREVARALAAVASVGGCSGELLGTVIEAITDEEPLPHAAWTTPSATIDHLVAELARVPLVRASGDGCWPHPLWADVTRVCLTREEHRRAIEFKVRGDVRAGAVNDAGRLALRTRNVEALVLVVRSALASQPPTASTADLRSWAAGELLPPGSAEHAWLQGVLGAQLGDVSDTSRLQLEQARQAFELAGDEEGETGVLLHLGTVARSRSDNAELGRLLGRAGVLAASGNPVALGLVALGQAVVAQLTGDPDEAVRVLDGVPPGALVGEWAAQALMVRGTNLLLAGRFGPAVAALDAATGVGPDASRAVAHDLLASARWYAGDPVGAIDDAATAETLALKASSPASVQLIRAASACLLAATGQRDVALDVLGQLDLGGSVSTAEEVRALAQLTEILLCIDADSLDAAKALLMTTSVPERAARSSVWKAALDTALSSSSADHWSELANHDMAMSRAVAAGHAAATHLAGGPLAGDHHRPFLPSRWCVRDGGPIVIRLIGAGTLARHFRSIDHPAWRRARVRELCLHLALVDDRSRARVAAALWPDRGDRSAGQNLRVTLTHLLDVLDPDRSKAGGSSLIADDGSLRFSRDAGLHIDVWDVDHHANAVLSTPDHEQPSLLAHARRLLSIEPGPLLGAEITGEWLEPHQRRLDDLVVTASLRGGSHALAAADHDLAHALGLRVLTIDPWSERAHRLVVEGRLRGGDLDGARRDLLFAVGMLEDVGLKPGRATVELTYRLGVAHPGPPPGTGVGVGRQLSHAVERPMR